MPQKKNPRRGRQYENIARELLYEFCFLAQPISIADDIGVDYFCTLFEPEATGRDADLLPRISFWIQIKGKNRAKTIDLTTILPMLRVLQAPFFIGIIDYDRRELNIFSGHYLIPLFAYKGSPNVKKLRAKPCEDKETTGHEDNFFQETKPGEYILYFPKVGKIVANTSDDDLNNIRRKMLESCSLMLENIASGILGEHTFSNHDRTYTLLFSGTGSFQTFEPNFFKRLGEVFFNLHYQYTLFPAERKRIMQLFDYYEKIYLELISAYGANHPYFSLAKNQYEGAKNTIKGTNS